MIRRPPRSTLFPYSPFFRSKDGIAIAARMPMIRMTTRSSMRVKPLSSCERWRSRYNIESSSDPVYRAPASAHRLSRRCVPRRSNVDLREPPALLHVRAGHFALAPHAGYCQPVHRRSPARSLAVNGSWTHCLAVLRGLVMFTFEPLALRIAARSAHSKWLKSEHNEPPEDR